ncbi:MAG: T9SS type A sorting domain-containing protein [Rhodothermia bacterium]|nr:T9SS type A sorting domain-containing protein [Rhodothermia bacterium]
MKILLLLSALMLSIASQIFAQSGNTVTFKDADGGCFPNPATSNVLTYQSTESGRNIYAGDVLTSSSPDPLPARIFYSGTRWELQVNDGSGWAVAAYNEVDSTPNPPRYPELGTWVSGDCSNIEVFNGTGTQTVILPISLASQSAQVENQAVTFSWKTVSETNNDRFVIEQQTPQGWKPVGEVQGKGTSIDLSEYSFTVPNLAYGAHVFRIAQYDKNGYVSYGRMMQVFVELTDTFALSEAYPNPFNPQTNFTLAVAQTQVVQINIYDLQGRKVATLHNGSLAGQTTHAFTFQAQDLSSGRYFVRVKGENFVANKSLVLVK